MCYNHVEDIPVYGSEVSFSGYLPSQVEYPTPFQLPLFLYSLKKERKSALFFVFYFSIPKNS